MLEAFTNLYFTPRPFQCAAQFSACIWHGVVQHTTWQNYRADSCAEPGFTLCTATGSFQKLLMPVVYGR